MKKEQLEIWRMKNIFIKIKISETRINSKLLMSEK